MSMPQRYVPNSFPLPHEVFELGLSPGPLLVYISLVYLKSMRHGADALSCSTTSKLVGLCAKSVRTHLHMLEDAGLIQIENSGGKFTYTLCPIRDMVEKRRAAVPVRARKVSWRSKTQTWITGEVFANVFPLPNDVFRLGLKAGDLLVYIYLLYCKNMKSDECWPSYSTIGKAVGMTKKTVQKHVDALINKGLVRAENTTVRWRDGRTYNGNLRYTLKPVEQVFREREKVQLDRLKQAEAQRKWDERVKAREARGYEKEKNTTL